MQHARFIRTLVPLVMLGLAGFLLGCSGQSSAPPLGQETKEALKKNLAERRAERKEAAEERAGIKKGSMRGMMKGRGPG
jgi:hypothetical protein